MEKEEITVMVGRDQSVVQNSSDAVITFIAPQRDEPVIENVTVSGNKNYNMHNNFYHAGVIWT